VFLIQPGLRLFFTANRKYSITTRWMMNCFYALRNTSENRITDIYQNARRFPLNYLSNFADVSSYLVQNIRRDQ